MPRGHYERKRKTEGRWVSVPGTRNPEANESTPVIENGAYVSLPHANAKIEAQGDAIRMLETELKIERNSTSLLEARCELYERLLDHITPKRQAE